MSDLVDVNLEILKKTAYESLFVIWIGIVIATVLPFIMQISYWNIVLSSIIGSIIIIGGSYWLLTSFRLKRTKEIGYSFDVILTKAGEPPLEEEKNMAKNDNVKVTLRDVGLKIDKKWLTVSLSFIGLSIVAANLLSYWLYETPWHLFGVLIGSVIGASIGVIGNYWLLKSNRIIKHLDATIHDSIGLKDSVLLRKFDKNDNLVEERKPE